MRRRMEKADLDRRVAADKAGRQPATIDWPGVLSNRPEDDEAERVSTQMLAKALAERRSTRVLNLDDFPRRIHIEPLREMLGLPEDGSDRLGREVYAVLARHGEETPAMLEAMRLLAHESQPPILLSDSRKDHHVGLFVCSKCGCVDNTALSNGYHSMVMLSLSPQDARTIEVLANARATLGLAPDAPLGVYCSVCTPIWFDHGSYGKGPNPNPTPGKGLWHGEFPRQFLPHGLFEKGPDGEIRSKGGIEKPEDYYRDTEWRPLPAPGRQPALC
jgi:hypothetical protein